MVRIDEVKKITEERNALHAVVHEFVSEITKLRSEIEELRNTQCDCSKTSCEQNT